jgi:6-phospho-beta-glucosidase
LKSLQHKNDSEAMLKRYHDYLDLRGHTYMAAETGKEHQLESLDPSVKEALASSGYAGVALDLIESLNGGKPKTMILNVLNKGAVWGMETDDVVEVPTLVDKGMTKPLAVGKIPSHCLGLMQQVKTYERLTIAAAVEGSYAKAVEALAVHPLVADHKMARQLVDAYSEKHAGYFPELH